MSERRAGRRGRWTRTTAVAFGAILLLLLPGIVSPGAAAYPVLPDSEWSPILGELVAPALTPGSSGSITFRVSNPLLTELVSMNVSLAVYAFNPTEGTGAQALPAGGTPTLGRGVLTYTVAPPVLPATTSWNWTVPVTVPSAAPTGDYAVRFAVSFLSANSSYLLESRGYFSSSAWAAATHYSNGTPTINASELGVSGIVPETSILVSSASASYVLYIILGVGLGLAALGAYWWTRSEAKSKSGTRRSSPPQSAPTAFGRSRRSDGD